MYRRVSLLLLLASLLLAPGHNSLAQQLPETLTNAGTLACTTTEIVPSPPADVVLSCSFEGVAGLTGSFSGFIAREGTNDFPAGKRVLIWSVLANSDQIALTDLVGRYGGQTGGDIAKRLIGGRDNLVILDPVTETSQIGGEPQPTVLNLRLQLVET